MSAFRRNKNAGGVSEEAERGCGPNPWNLCRSSYRREAIILHMLLPVSREAFFSGAGRKNGKD